MPLATTSKRAVPSMFPVASQVTASTKSPGSVRRPSSVCGKNSRWSQGPPVSGPGGAPGPA
eukprot:4182228-Lingulodinium_polyedra.AAC.1